MSEKAIISPYGHSADWPPLPGLVPFNLLKNTKMIVFFFFYKLAFLADSVIESPCPSVCLSVCLRRFETPTSGCCWYFWSQNVLLILACDDNMLKGRKKAFAYIRIGWQIQYVPYAGTIKLPLLCLHVSKYIKEFPGKFSKRFCMKPSPPPYAKPFHQLPY